MTTFLAVCVAVLAVTVVAQFLLSMAIVRRLSALESSSAQRPVRRVSADGLVVRPVPSTERSSRSGAPPREIESGHAQCLEGEWLLAFTMPGCQPCVADRSHLAAVSSQRFDEGRRTALVVVGPTQPTGVELDGAIVLHDDMGSGALSSLMDVTAFPTYVLITDGVTMARGSSLDEVGFVASRTSS